VNGQTQQNQNWTREIGRLVFAATISFMTWKLLQATVGEKIDEHIDRRRNARV